MTMQFYCGKMNGKFKPYLRRRTLLLIIILLSTLPVFAQQQITGEVKDETGTAIPAITIRIKGKSGGTQTALNGQFSIKASPKDTLLFSGIGYANNQVAVDARTRYTIVMRTQVNSLTETVVIGYAQVKRADVTGSVVKAPIEDMQKAPVRSIDEALGGRVAGVVVSSVDGQPGSANNIVIRGANSVTQDNSPLYVIDGFPIENPDNNFIQPQDVESIDVLKDASATAIYGSRGANGVIMITTKRGKSGAPAITLSAYYGLQKDRNRMKLMNPYEFVQYQVEKSPADAANIYLRDGRTLNFYRNIPEIDWQDQFLHVAPMFNTSLSVRGGNDKTKYYVSGNVFGQNGVIINSDYRRYQGSVSLDQTFNNKVKAGIYLNIAHNKRSGISPSNPSSTSSTAASLYSVYGYRNFSLSGANDVSDDLFDPFIDPSLDLRINPILNQRHLVRDVIGRNTILNGYVDYAVTSKLKLRITGGLNETFTQNNTFNDTLTVYGNRRTLIGSTNGVNGSVIFNKNTTWINENTLTYNETFNKSHNLTLLAGITESGNRTSGYGSSATNLPRAQLGISGLNEGTPQTVTAVSSLWGLMSYLGRVDYKYKSRYLLTASYRADGSSKFAPGNKWGYFPSGALAWRFSQENFLKNNRVISDGKLRVSYGLTGNNRVTDFPYQTQMIISYNPYAYTFGNGIISGAVPGSPSNEDLKWETTEQTDVGLDLSFFKNRINITADIYRKVTRDLLLNANIPLSLGYNQALRNIGRVRNQGLELTISTDNINKRDFGWKSSFNISFNQSKILQLSEKQEAILAYAPFDATFRTIPSFITKVGNQLGMMYGYVWDGVYQYSDFNVTTTGNYILKDNIPTNGNTRSAIQPGDIKFKDLNGDLAINASDYAIIGRGLPIHTGGFNNDFRYRNFDLNLFFQWSYGNDIINANRYIFEGNILNRANLNQFASYLDRWSPTNQSSTLFRAGFGGAGPSTPTGANSRVIEDGSYLRLKTVQLGYNLPAKSAKRMGLKSLRMYCAAQNLITWTKYSGVDPEVSIYNSVLTPGVDYSAYPRPFTITLGANASF
ncbi:TonB-dependent receptor [Mucilaginibacter sp. PAMB04168]|uniref:SusC/RagA family TonB-linked outer membrane protein n=1 Tax=Mucilaginibacter sp. PAMB04168 TaxID=3138567 RepID=UPI0031F68135